MLAEGSNFPSSIIVNIMDEEDAQQICRTCLKSTSQILPVFNLSDCCTSQKSYGQLLEEYAKFEFTSEQETKLPQGLCAICCRHLKRVHTFITRAQICNHKLMDMTVNNNQLDCLREEAIDLPVNQCDEDQVNDKTENDFINNDDNVSTGNSVNDDLFLDGHLSNCDEIDVTDLVVSDEESLKSSSELKEDENIPNSSLSKYSTKLYNEAESSTKITCPICTKILKRRMYLLKHLRKVHHIDKASSFLKKHMGQQENTNVYKIHNCTHCDYTAKSSAALTYHTRTKHTTEEDKYKCKFCSFESLKRWALVGHVKNEHKVEFKTLKKNVEKKQNVIGPSNDSDSQDSCGVISTEIGLEDSSDDDGFIRDMITEERRITRSKYVDGEPFNALARKCEECGKIYKNFQSLYAHKRFVHISEDMYSVCLHCGKKYKRSQDLKNHILQFHSNADSSSTVPIPDVQGKRFMCTECPYATTTTTHLKIHIRRHHTGEKPFVCEICGNSFLTSYCLKKHRYLHTGEKPHKCPFCPKSFRVSSKLTKHKRIHTGERPFKCAVCGKGFTQEYNLSVHKRTHTKERNVSLPVEW